MKTKKKPVWCGLKDRWKACCCNCKYHVRDYHHCATTGQKDGKCVCSQLRGFACIVCLDPALSDSPRIHSGWSEHGMCELHEPREKEPAK